MSKDDRRGWLEEFRIDLGDEAADQICAAAGGQRRYIPRTACAGWILHAAGADAEQWLAERFGGEELHIPLLETVRQVERRRQMGIVAAAEGASANELARRLGVNRRTVQRLREALRAQASGEEMEGAGPQRPDPRQLDLPFGD